ncbi:MAG: peptidylprolyl isomerase [Candidatus Woesearchaeota archaeon]
MSKTDHDEKKKSSEPKRVKVNRKKTKRRKTEIQKPASKNSILYVIAAIVLVAVFAILISISGDSDGNTDTGEPETSIVAEVNGEEITLEEINRQYDLLPAEMQQTITKEVLLNRTIDEMILVQEAENQGITVTNMEVQEYIQQLMQQSGITEEALEQQLEQTGMTRDDLEAIYEKQLKITKLLNQTDLGIEVSDEEIQQYYDENTNSSMITVPQQVRARHILLQNESLAQELLGRLEDESFADLAQNYSQDTGSAQQGGDLGYFPEGAMVPAFNDAVFSMDVNDSPRIVESSFGYHIVDVTGTKEGYVNSLEEVESDIRNAIEQQKQQEALTEYITDLRNDADVTINKESLSDTGSDNSGSGNSGSDIETFNKIGDDVCTEDGKPIIRVYTSSTCPHCHWVNPAVDEVLKEYSDQIVARHWEVDTKDDLLTPEEEGSIPAQDMQVYQENNPEGYVPYFDFGCVYNRVGTGYEREDDLEKEKQEFRTIIEELI